MKTFKERIKREVHVWSIIVGVFTIMTIVAANFYHIRQLLDGDLIFP